MSNKNTTNGFEFDPFICKPPMIMLRPPEFIYELANSNPNFQLMVDNWDKKLEGIIQWKK